VEQSATCDKSLSLETLKRKLKTYLFGQCQWPNSIRRRSVVFSWYRRRLHVFRSLNLL